METYIKNRIGFALSSESESSFQSFNPTTLEELPEKYAIANNLEIEQAMDKAWSAFKTYRNIPGREKARFLNTIADEILELGDELIEHASKETGLPEQRIIGERGRTINQLKMFAQLIEEGSWVEASIDTAIPDRQPLPKPNVRRMLRPLGPVVVFTASNFPLAFSTAGGDTASALAGGNPVVVKAHPSHPGTNHLISEAINKAAQKCNIPDGIFSTLYSNKYELGIKLVQHEFTKAVGFTGSFQGGMALVKAANEREEPIPVFAEMGSTNPVILLPEKLKSDSQNVAKTMATSVSMGAGQFCTNPGIMAAIDGPELEEFVVAFTKEANNIAPQTMLNKGIWDSFHTKKEKALNEKGVKILWGENNEKNNIDVSPSLASISFSDFKQNTLLHEEIFGPYSLLVICKNITEVKEFIKVLKGQLTTSVFADGDDFNNYKDIFELLEQKTGRLIVNNPPTGVEVCPSMHHGGPFPSTTDSRFTSVGTEAIKRFVRPVSYQNLPQELLPDEIKDGNPLKIWRYVNGEFKKD